MHNNMSSLSAPSVLNSKNDDNRLDETPRNSIALQFARQFITHRITNVKLFVFEAENFQKAPGDVLSGN